MWDNYYDKVVYQAKSNKLDAAGNKVYSPPRKIDVRFVSGGQEQVINKEGVDIKYTKEYQIPFMINEGDTIEGHQVVYVEPSKDVFGNFHFCIAKVK